MGALPIYSMDYCLLHYTAKQRKQNKRIKCQTKPRLKSDKNLVIVKSIQMFLSQVAFL